MADTVISGKKAVRERMACALSARTSSVTVDRYKYSGDKRTVQCAGEWEGKKVFAKIFLVDPYPIPIHFIPPWETPSSVATPAREIGDQIESEWEMTLKMRAFSNGRCVPAPLGKSVPARVIVWEEMKGDRLDHAVKWSRWNSPMADRGREALYQAGTWLRKLHEASNQGSQTIEVSRLVSVAIGLSSQTKRNTSPYDRTVSKILDNLLSQIGGAGTFTVPVALSHGDFALVNIFWDNASCRLGIIDFELSGFRPIYYDLFALTSDLRSQLLNPFIPKAVILSCERSFWHGYGTISTELLMFVKCLALARTFYYSLSRLQSRRERKGWIAGFNARLYRTFLERRIITQRLDLPFAFAPSAYRE